MAGTDLVTILGVVLAGGQSRRMGGVDKAFVELDGRPLVGHVIDRALPQVDRLIVNANGGHDRFSDYGLPVVSDLMPGHAGPLAGILTAMIWARENVGEAIWIASFPTDAPLIPDDLVSGLLTAVCEDETRLACAESAGRTHPVIGLWPIALADDLLSAMRDEDIRKIDRWTVRHPLSEVSWPVEPFDPFLNINRPEDVERAEAILGSP